MGLLGTRAVSFYHGLQEQEVPHDTRRLTSIKPLAAGGWVILFENHPARVDGHLGALAEALDVKNRVFCKHGEFPTALPETVGLFRRVMCALHDRDFPYDSACL